MAKHGDESAKLYIEAQNSKAAADAEALAAGARIRQANCIARNDETTENSESSESKINLTITTDAKTEDK